MDDGGVSAASSADRYMDLDPDALRELMQNYARQFIAGSRAFDADWHPVEGRWKPSPCGPSSKRSLTATVPAASFSLSPRLAPQHTRRQEREQPTFSVPCDRR
jgi:hypothetical protein